MAVDTISLAAILSITGCAPRAADLVGWRLGAYRLVERIGAGASAVVYRARHEVMGVDRAVKVMLPRVAHRTHERRRFVHEVRIAAAIRHPNVVSVHDCGVRGDGTAYLVMDYVCGRSLAERLREGVPAATETLAIAAQVAAALDHAHRLGVVHLDVKPANVLLGEDGVVRLGDFGTARRDGDLSEPGRLLGTPAYMSPEQCRGESQVDHRADVYSLAAVLFEMLTGRPPHGRGEDAIAQRLRGQQPPRPRALNPYLPETADAVLARGLAADCGVRPATAGELIAELAAALAVDAPIETTFLPTTSPAVASAAAGLTSVPTASLPPAGEPTLPIGSGRPAAAPPEAGPAPGRLRRLARLVRRRR